MRGAGRVNKTLSSQQINIIGLMAWSESIKLLLVLTQNRRWLLNYLVVVNQLKKTRKTRKNLGFSSKVPIKL